MVSNELNISLVRPLLGSRVASCANWVWRHFGLHYHCILFFGFG